MLLKVIAIVLGTLLLPCKIDAQTQSQPPTRATAQTTPKRVVEYGSNAAVGRTFTHDGVRLYYEVYGAGEPLLLIHGNGTSISSLNAQIDHFRKSYRVIAMTVGIRVSPAIARTRSPTRR